MGCDGSLFLGATDKGNVSPARTRKRWWWVLVAEGEAVSCERSVGDGEIVDITIEANRRDR